jgi:hypothetical protein
MKYLPIIFSIIFLSCSPEKQLNKLQIKHPEVVSKKTSEWYPCVVTKIISDSSQYKDFMIKIDSLNRIDTCYLTDTLVSKDTIIKTYKKLLIKYREVVRHLPSIHDTVRVLDKADLTAKEYELKQMAAKSDDYNKKYTRSLFYMGILWLVIVCLLLYAYIKK